MKSAIGRNHARVTEPLKGGVRRVASRMTVGQNSTRSKAMSTPDNKSGQLPTNTISKEQRVILVESLLVTWKAMEHLRVKGMIKPLQDGSVPLRRDDGCCKPDGGTCCPNKKEAA
jgi:hypothetical protein